MIEEWKQENLNFWAKKPTEEEIFEILRLVKETRLTYMMAETCYYFPCAVWTRDQYKKGAFGKFTYGESQYYHDISEMYSVFYASAHNTDKSWQWFAGIPVQSG